MGFTFLWLHLFFPFCSDADRFPATFLEKEQYQHADTEILIRQKHTRRIQMLRELHGWSRGVWDEADRENDLAIRYWGIVQLLHDSDYTMEFKRDRLRELHKLIGPERYYQGWRPILFPAYLEPDPDTPPPRIMDTPNPARP